jgi:hypothetical protein
MEGQSGRLPDDISRGMLNQPVVPADNQVTFSVVVWTLVKYLKVAFALRAADPIHAPSLAQQLGVLNLINESAMLITLYGVKACVLCIYYRITLYRAEHYVANVVSVYCIAGYITLMVYLFAGFCRPFSQFFAVNPTDTQCASWKKYNRLNLILNVSSDVLIVLIPISLVTRSQIKTKQKIVLCCIFGLGLIVCAFAVTNKILTLVHSGTTVWIAWYVRESGMAMVVSNFLLCWPLLRKMFPSLSTFSVHGGPAFFSEIKEDSSFAQSSFARGHGGIDTQQTDLENGRIVPDTTKKPGFVTTGPRPLLPDVDEVDIFQALRD